MLYICMHEQWQYQMDRHPNHKRDLMNHRCHVQLCIFDLNKNQKSTQKNLFMGFGKRQTFSNAIKSFFKPCPSTIDDNKLIITIRYPHIYQIPMTLEYSALNLFATNRLVKVLSKNSQKLVNGKVLMKDFELDKMLEMLLAFLMDLLLVIVLDLMMVQELLEFELEFALELKMV